MILSSKEKSRWSTGAVNSAPSILASEYYTLYSLVHSGAGYQAVCKLRDFLEVFTRLTVLSCAAHVLSTRKAAGMTDEEACEPIAKVITESAELGTYENIIDDISKNKSGSWLLPPVLSELVEIIRGLKNAQNKNGVNTAKFRNDYIGHGAYMFDLDERVMEDFSFILGKVRTALEACKPLWQRFAVCIAGSKQTGWKAVAHPAFNKERVTVVADGQEIDMSVFLLFENKRFYFYDGFSRDYKRVNYLCFSDGDRFGRTNELIERLYAKFSTNRGESVASLENGTISEEVSIIFDENSNLALDYLEPEELTAQLENCLSSHKKGFIQFIGEANLGKSAFCAALDPLLSPYTCIEIPHTVVRCYYGNRCAVREGMDFPNFTTAVFNLKNENGKRRIKRDIAETDPSKHIAWGQAQTASDIAMVLNEWRRRYENYGEAERLLYVIDSIDALLCAYDGFDKFIPNPNQLDDGVFVMFTSRRDISDAIPITATININNKEGRKFAEKYLSDIAERYCGAKLRRVSDELTENMSIALAAGMVMKYKGIKVARLNAEDCITEYISILRGMYGEKLFVQAKTMVSALVDAKNGLTLKDLCRTLGYDCVNAQVLGILRDLSCFIDKDVDGRGIYYSLKRELHLYLY